MLTRIDNKVVDQIPRRDRVVQDDDCGIDSEETIRLPQASLVKPGSR